MRMSMSSNLHISSFGFSFGCWRMSQVSEEVSSSCGHQAIHVISAVKELHGLSSVELSKRVRDSENHILPILAETGPCQIDVEKLARYLPLHLIAKVMLSERDEALFKYLLCGVRLLHSLCDLAPRHSRLEQILLDDVKVSEQLLDLVFYLLIVLSNYRQEQQASSPIPLLHSALVACSLYLLTGCIASQWQDVASVLIAHRKVDIFMESAFAALRIDIKFLQIKLLGLCNDLCANSSFNEGALSYLCQQCEASLQFLQSLCQQKSFRERLVKNKELCGRGGVLLLAQGILSLNITPLLRESSSVVAAVSRLKSKVLSILLHLCESESVSYLDEVASTPQSMDLTKSVALEVREVLKTMVVRDPKQLGACTDKNYPTGLLQLNAMRLADIFSDDSNFRSFITIYFTEVLTAIFSVPHQEFLSSWCSSDLPLWEEDATLEYDSFAAAGCVMDSFPSSDLPNVTYLGSTLVPSNLPKASYAHQRASLLVKVIANLHCFAPEICKEEKDVFVNKFVECLRRELLKLPASDSEKASIVSRNIRSLLNHAESLSPPFLNDEDVDLLRRFYKRLEPLLTPAEFEFNRVQEAQSAGGCSSAQFEVGPLHIGGSNNLKEGISDNSAFHDESQYYVRSNCIDETGNIVRQDKGGDNGKSGMVVGDLMEIDGDVQIVETSGSDSSSTRGKTFIDPMHNVNFPNSSEHIKESGFRGPQQDEKVETVQGEEKQQRKRKRTIMNDKQLALIERALLDEPDMQRNAASIQSWADKLSVHGFEVTTSQLKNWLNNRKARLARAAKDVHAPPSEEENALYEKQDVSGAMSQYDSAERPAEDVNIPSTATGFVQGGHDQYVLLVDAQGEEIGKGKVYQVQGKWHGRDLKESEMCVVDVIELKAERQMRLPHPCEGTGSSFDEVEEKLGLMRVLWDSNKLYMLPPK